MGTHRFWLIGTLFSCLAFKVTASVLYVDVNSVNPVAPYSSWGTAATNIQDAVDTAVDGDEVLVTNGIYASGGRAVHGTMTNRVAINKAMTVRSVNGPLVTAISGAIAVGGTSTGDGAIRCLYVGTNAVMSGFTLTNGHTRAAGDSFQEQSGAGAWCELSGVVSNCTLSCNSAQNTGGGAYSGTLNDCTLSGNSALYGGGAYNSALNRCILSGNSVYSLDGGWDGGQGGGALGGTLNNCILNGNGAYIYGGGALYATLNNCTLSGNWAQNTGGGAFDSILNNCTLSGNQAAYGGGAAQGTLNNCTLSSNWVWVGGGGAFSAWLNNCTFIRNSANGDGGGAMYGTLNNCTLCGNSATGHGGATFSGSVNNCIVYYNSAPSGPNSIYSLVNYSCTAPAADGLGNITNEPLFVNTNAWADLRLKSNSPCIDAGADNYASGTGLDGRPRLISTVDMGAYEFQGPFDAWLQKYGLPIDGSADYADPDLDGSNNWQEWIVGTDPTNTASVLKMIAASNSTSGVAVSWLSVPNRNYSIFRSTNLPSFIAMATDLPGQTNSTSYLDTNSAGTGPAFYRVGVQGSP